MSDVNSSTPKIKKRFIFLGFFLLILVGVPLYLGLTYGSLIKSFLNPPKEDINILVLGKGGSGHDAPDLTDTIIFASVSDEEVNLISLPRDIWVPEIRAKINSAYYWGKEQNGNGLPLASESVSKIVGKPVNYSLVIDFSIFKDLIDALGGVNVDVENSFVDAKFPIEGRENDLCGGDKRLSCRYETISFEKGKQMMDGETALKFVRSRNAEGDEGTDLAREARQQKVITAIKGKALDSKVFLNPMKVNLLMKVFLGSIETDIDRDTAAGILKRFLNVRDSVKSHLVPEEFLINPPISPRYDNLYVFIHRGGNWNEVQEWVRSILD